MPWPLAYILASFLLVALFCVLGAVLLFHRSRRGAVRRSPQSVSTPLGNWQCWNEETQKLVAPGIERARQRDSYYVKGREQPDAIAYPAEGFGKKGKK